MSSQFILTAELAPHLDPILEVGLPRSQYTKYTNPFGAIARPTISPISELLVTSDSTFESPIITREQVDVDPTSACIICNYLDSLKLETTVTSDDSYYASTPHYISSLWNYLNMDDDLVVDHDTLVDASNTESVRHSDDTQFKSSMNSEPVATFSPFPASTIISRKELYAIITGVSTTDNCPPPYNYYRSGVFDPEPLGGQLTVAACDCPQCKPLVLSPQSAGSAVDDSELVTLSPPETPLPPTPSSDKDSFPDYFELADGIVS